MNRSFIHEILEDLYALEPELKRNEAKIKKLIQQMIKLQPDTQFSSTFKKELKSKILAEIEEMKQTQAVGSSFFQPIRQRLYQRKYTTAGVVVAGLVLLIMPMRRDGTIVQNQGDFFNLAVLESEESDGVGAGVMRNMAKTAAPQAMMEIESMAVTTDMTMDDMSANIAFTVGADQDMMLFRENIKNGYIPNTDTITYNGIFSDYHFPLPKGKCETMFCPLLAQTEIEDTKRVQIGLGSNVTEADYQRPPTNFVFVIDRSGSMGSPLDSYYYDDLFDDDWIPCAHEETYFRPAQTCIARTQKKHYSDQYRDFAEKTKMQLAMDALTKMLDKLQPEDSVAIVLFDDTAELAHPVKPVADIDLAALKKHLLRVSDRGGTNMEAGMEMAISLFDEDFQHDTQNRVVFITDAMPNIDEDSPYGLGKMVAEAVEDKIYFSFLGVGVDFQQQFIQKLSHHEGTNYFFISDARDFQRRLVDEFDYNFFPMIFDLDFSISDPEAIEKVYGTDLSDKERGEVLHINTLFPTPPTAQGHRGSIILLKLADDAPEDLEFTVSYRDFEGETTIVEAKLDEAQQDKDDTIAKAVLLTEYADALKTAVRHNTIKVLKTIEEQLTEQKDLFEGDDEDMYREELGVLEALAKLIEEGEPVKEDYWQGE